MPGPNYSIPWRQLRRRPASLLVVALVRLYQLTLSPFVGQQCRHLPSCSNYMLEAVVRHGFWHGSWLGLRRVSRCGPGGTCGYDPVPPEEKHSQGV